MTAIIIIALTLIIIALAIAIAIALDCIDEARKAKGQIVNVQNDTGPLALDLARAKRSNAALRGVITKMKKHRG